MLVFDSMQEATKDFGKKAVKAGVKTVNIVAATARKNAIAEIKRKFTLRNRFTVNSVRFTQCPSSVGKLSDVKSSVGILEQAGYMARQETGGERKSRTGANLVIPNTNARKGGTNRGLVSSAFRYGKIKSGFVRRQSSSKLALAAAAFNAAKNKGFIRINDTIFRVKRFSPKRDNRLFVSVPVLNMRFKSTFTPSREWLRPSAFRAAELIPKIFTQKLDEEFQ